MYPASNHPEIVDRQQAFLWGIYHLLRDIAARLHCDTEPYAQIAPLSEDWQKDLIALHEIDEEKRRKQR